METPPSQPQLLDLTLLGLRSDGLRVDVGITGKGTNW